MSVYHKDNSEHLSLSIKSMLEQSYLCSQFVIVKDGILNPSLDEVIDHYSLNNKNLFTIIQLKENKGLGSALDIGLTYCKYEIVARMDADDISLPTRCEEELECFVKNSNLSIVGSYINEFYNNPDNVIASRHVPLEHDEIVKFARRRSPFNHPTVMFKKTAVQESGGYGSSRRKEDLKLFPAMVNRGFEAMNIPKVLLLYRTNADNAKRRKTWTNCKEYISVIYSNYRDGYSTFFDFLYVLVAQIIIYLIPLRLFKYITKIFLRKKAG